MEESRADSGDQVSDIGGTEMSREIPQHIKDRANENIVDVIRGYVPALKKTGKNWSACCPFHDEKSPSFTVSDKGFYKCFGCQAKGDAIGFVMDYQNVDFRTAVKSILGEIELEEVHGNYRRPPTVRAIQCSLPGHAEDRERTANFLSQCIQAEQHMYLARNNTAPSGKCLTLKGSLIVPLINNIGEEVNAAAITSKGISYAAGNPSFGSTAILEAECEPDGKTILCVDYAHAWRIWWAQSGASRVLCAMSADNFRWMLANCKDRFTHVGCDPSEADEHVDAGRAIVALPLDPYARLDKQVQVA